MKNNDEKEKQKKEFKNLRLKKNFHLTSLSNKNLFHPYNIKSFYLFIIYIDKNHTHILLNG